MTKHTLQFRLSISAEMYAHYYRGNAREIVTTTTSGQSLRFPLSALQEHVLHDGVNGMFEISFDQNHKLVSLIKLAD